VTSLYYNNNRTNVTIICVFDVANDYSYPYLTKIVAGGTTLKENKFET